MHAQANQYFFLICFFWDVGARLLKITLIWSPVSLFLSWTRLIDRENYLFLGHASLIVKTIYFQIGECHLTSVLTYVLVAQVVHREICVIQY